MFNKLRKYITHLIDEHNLEMEKWKEEDPDAYYEYLFDTYAKNP